MNLVIYLHRTKKHNFKVCDKFGVGLNLDKIFEDNPDITVDKLNQGFFNDIKLRAKSTKSVNKYGTGYIGFIHPTYEGSDEENGNDIVYFDNATMKFQLKDIQKGD